MKPVTGNFTGYRLTGNRLTTLLRISFNIKKTFCKQLDGWTDGDQLVLNEQSYSTVARLVLGWVTVYRQVNHLST